MIYIDLKITIVSLLYQQLTVSIFMIKEYCKRKNKLLLWSDEEFLKRKIHS